MEPERWREIEKLFHAAMERGESEREAFLKEACGADEELRREVESLLAQEDKGFLEKPAGEWAVEGSLGRPPESGGAHEDGGLRPPLQRGASFSHYRIIEELGAGGMGVVYQAEDTRLKRRVALKFLAVAPAPGRTADGTAAPPGAAALARFEREARLASALNHPNICAVYDVGEHEGRPFISMELVGGRTLAERMAAPRPHTPPASRPAEVAGAERAVPLQETLGIARQVAEALEYSHERGIVHRDLKPANIKITPEGTVKVLDFGLAKALGLDTGPDAGAERAQPQPESPTLSGAMTEPGMIMGTAAYMSPEQASGKPVDRRADIWAFGCVLYEMLAGQRAFRGDSMPETLAAALKTEPDWNALPGTTPPAIARLVRRCLVKDPKQRLRDIGEARIAIEETISGVGEGEALPDGADTARRAPLRRTLPWALAAALVAGAALAYFILQSRPASPRPGLEGVIRFSLSPPENTTFAEFALSPDGRRLAFVSTIAGTKRQLWVRPLDSLTPELLPGTEGASWPFWSPGGRYLGFYAEGKLKKVEVSGGAPETLCDAAGVGATWSGEGVIVFTNQWHLYRVPESGGAPSLVAAPDTGRHETACLAPQFLPDGRHFVLFAALGTLEGRAEIGSLDSKEREILSTVATNALYAPPGYLLYLEEGTLMARGFDAMQLRFSGEALPVAENVGSVLGPGYSKFSVSPSGVLAFQNGASRGGSQMVWFDRKGAKLGTLGQAGFYTNPALSPDGTKLAVALLDPKINTRDIWVYDLKRGTDSRLTFNPTDDLNPTWPPDGSRILFTSRRKGQRDIYQKPANGLGITESVFESKDQAKSINDQSPDGRYAIYDTTAVPANLWILPLFGERKPYAFVQGSFHAAQARFSPNGRYIAYASEETGQPEVYVQTFPEHGGKWQVSTSGGTEPMWRGDGKELFYLGANNKVMAVEVKTDSVQFEAGIPKALFEIRLIDGSWRNRYVVSPDGQRFLMIVPAGEAKPPPITVVVNWTALLKKSGK